MDEDYYEEVLDQEEKVAAVPPIPVFAVAPLNVEVPEFPDNPESPSPEPSPAASPAASPPASPPSSPPASPGPGSPQPHPGDAPNVMGFFSADDVTELEQWAVDAQSLRGTPDLRLEEPELSANFKIFLKFIWGTNGSSSSFSRRGRSSSVS